MECIHRLFSRDFAAKLALAGGLLVTGCESLGPTKKFKNPVVPPAPRRVNEASQDGDLQAGTAHIGVIRKVDDAEASASPAESARQAALARSGASGSRNAAGQPQARVRAPEPAGNPPGDVIQTRASQGGIRTDWHSVTRSDVGAQPIGASEVAATVNGIPIFVEDVLKPAAPQLREAERQLTADDFRKLRRRFTQQLMQPHIERELLVQALRTKLKDEQFEGLNKHLDAQFEEELRTTMDKLKVNTPGELEVALRKSGTSIENIRNDFRNQRMAQQYLALKTQPKDGFDRPDLLRHYQENLERYAVAGEVKWQQISLKFSRHGGKAETNKVADWILDQLDRGADFGELARKYSAGPTAKNGGFWDWTKQGSLAAQIMDDALFQLPRGEISAPLETQQTLEIVRVIDRKEAGYQSFESVQADIKKELREAEFRKSAAELLAELRNAATIEDLTEQL
jgi:peptidyl-prolyl cis-trans isomerase SurA